MVLLPELKPVGDELFHIGDLIRLKRPDGSEDLAAIGVWKRGGLRAVARFEQSGDDGSEGGVDYVLAMRNAIFLLLLAVGAASAQPADASMAFEVASIKPSAPRGAGGGFYGCKGGPGSTDPGRIACTNISLVVLVQMAYGVDYSRFSGMGLPMQDFDIVAKLPEGAIGQVPRMWQNLLAERFKLVIHREKKEVPSYLLVVAKGGLKIKEAVNDPASDDKPAWSPGDGPAPRDKDGFPMLPPGSTGTAFRGGKAYLMASIVPMESIASMLETRLNAGTEARRPVIDGTGLKGKYTFRLTLEQSGDAMADDLAFRSALENEIGLKVEQKLAQVEILVVDHVERLPTEN